MKAHTLLMGALVAGVIACFSDPVGPGPHGPGFVDENPDPSLVTITGQVMVNDGVITLEAFEGEWAGQALTLVGTPADELESYEGAIVRVKGTVLGTEFDLDGYELILH